MSPSTRVTLLAALVLVACDNGDRTDLEDYVRQVKARAPGPIDPLPELAPIVPFAFAPASRRDPFAPDRRNVAIATAPAIDDIAPDPLRSREALERFPLDALAMVGTLMRGGIIRALIRTPEGDLSQVGVGNYMGADNGRVTRITEGRIELTERVSDGGAWSERRATIALSR